MKRWLLIGIVLLVCAARANAAQQAYAPPEVTLAGDAYVPYQVLFDGLFILDVFLNDDGEVQRIIALRDPGSMLGAAKKSVQMWKFQPAAKGVKSAPRRMTVSFVYRPPNYGIAAPVPPKDFSPVLPPDQSDSALHGEYVPVGILSFSYPEYPVNSRTWGSVVVQLTVDGSGRIAGVDFLHGMKGFNYFVSKALKAWRFQAATFNGKAITSKTVIAFVFQPPISS